MSKEKRDGNVAARTICEQMVDRLKSQGCETENCGGTYVIQTPAGAELHLAAQYFPGCVPLVWCEYWGRDSHGEMVGSVEVPYDVNLNRFCEWAMAL